MPRFRNDCDGRERSQKIKAVNSTAVEYQTGPAPVLLQLMRATCKMYARIRIALQLAIIIKDTLVALLTGSIMANLMMYNNLYA